MVERLARREPDPRILDQVFRALGDRTRRDMLRRLAGGERTVTELAEPCAMSLAAASKHVRVLERAGLVRRTIRGRTHHCRLAAAREDDVHRPRFQRRLHGGRHARRSPTAHMRGAQPRSLV